MLLYIFVKLPESLNNYIFTFYSITSEEWFIKKRKYTCEIKFLYKRYIYMKKDIYFNCFLEFYFSGVNYLFKSKSDKIDYKQTIYSAKACSISLNEINLQIQYL